MLLVVLQALGGVDSFFTATVLAPGIALFGFVMLMFSTAMALARDRESALFARLLTAPLRSLLRECEASTAAGCRGQSQTASGKEPTPRPIASR